MTRARSLTPQEYRAALTRAFKLDDQDLAANREGRLGPRQAQRLTRTGWLGLAAAIGGDAAALALILAVAARPFQPVQIIVTVIILAALPIVAAVYLVKSRADAIYGEVLCFTGPIRKVLRGRAGWFLYVGDRDFRMPIRPQHISDEVPHRVYVTPKAKRIIAMEPDIWG